MNLPRALAVPLVVLQVAGCATAAPPRSSPVPPGVSAAEQRECESFAQEEAERAAAGIPSKAGETAAAAGTALIVPNPIVGIAGLLLAVPLAIVGGIVGASQTERERTQRRAAASAAAMETCLKPLVLAQRLGPGHPDVAQALIALAVAYAAQGRRDTADALMQRAEDVVDHALSGPAPASGQEGAAQALVALAAAFDAQGRHDTADALVQRADKMLQAALSEPAPAPGQEAVWATLETLARFHADRGDTAKADAALRRSLEAREHALGPDHLELADALSRGAGLLGSLNQDEAAATLAARADVIRTMTVVAPHRWDFGEVTPGTKSRPVSLVFTNRTRRVLHVRASLPVARIVKEGSFEYVSGRPGDFALVRHGCQDPVEVEGTCTLEAEFAPTGLVGWYSTTLELHVQELGRTLSVYLSGRAQVAKR